ncbi:hypothetical protein AC3_A0447 [Clostridium perfringens E str. JGS1987]|uniref:Uncharacterized protein n=1 Tax=Clostridium perfringens E str. JGS1987 TaxID=451755 RepID=B1BUN7_CLOPF|nr:hypothetical protein AC3_A0447 [Clostridium perfringens E str. JGS1987]
MNSLIISYIIKVLYFMFIFRLYDYEAVSELCSFAAFFCLRRLF